MERVEPGLLQALILTKNEEPNLGRVLDKLTWLEKIIIVDSFSTDNTLRIGRTYPNVTFYQRSFDTHANQWNYGLGLVKSKWVLTLDADYVLTEAFAKETMGFLETGNKVAYYSKFKFLVYGRSLMGDNTTPRPVLFKLSHCAYFDDGHTQRLNINGDTGFFNSPILHDDRKSLSRWLNNQDSYSLKEAHKLMTQREGLSLSSRFRKNRVLAPMLVFFHCLFVKGLIFSGWSGWYYTLQRTMVEMLLAIRLIEEEKLK